VTVGELRRGLELIRSRGDAEQAQRLEDWLGLVVRQFEGRILAFHEHAAQDCEGPTAPDPHHAFDKQIAAIALVNDLVLVTRNTSDFKGSGVRLRNPFV
jgi:toxin FitB